MSFGRKLKMIRAEYGIKQEDMCKTLNISQSVLSKHETEKNSYNEHDPFVIEVSQAYNKSIKWLLADDTKNYANFESGSIGSGTGIGLIENYYVNVPKDLIDVIVKILGKGL